MASRRKPDQPPPKRRRPATSPEQREQELVGLAYDLLEERLRDRTASSQEVTTLIKFGSTREALEQQRIAYEIQLSEARRKAAEHEISQEKLMEEALDAFRSYQPNASVVEEYDED